MNPVFRISGILRPKARDRWNSGGPAEDLDGVLINLDNIRPNARIRRVPTFCQFAELDQLLSATDLKRLRAKRNGSARVSPMNMAEIPSELAANVEAPTRDV